MHRFKISEYLQSILAKLAKKDKSLYEQILKKIQEIADTPDIEHYKNKV